MPAEYDAVCKLFAYVRFSCGAINSATVTCGSVSNIISETFGVPGLTATVFDHFTL